MKRSIIGAAVAVSLLLASFAHAQATTVPIGDPYTDTLQLWSEIAGLVEYLDHALATALTPSQVQTTAAVHDQQTASLAEAVASFETPIATSTTVTTTTATSDQTTLSDNVKSASNQQQTELSQTNSAPADPTTALNASNFVTQTELTAQLNALTDTLTAKFSQPATTTPPQYVGADGNPTNPFAAENAINNLSGVTITNANLTASEIPNLSGSYLSLNGGTVSGSFFDTATSSSYFLGSLGIGTSTAAVPLEIQDTAATSTAVIGSNIVSDGTFTSNPSSTWTLGSGWSWDSTNDRAQYSGTGGPIASASIGDGGTGYVIGDTVTVTGGTGDATYSVTSVNSGTVNGISQVSPGTAYTVSGSPNSTTGGTGSGLTVIINTIASGATLSETLTPSGPSATYYSTSYDSWITGTTYQVSFTIANYSGHGQVQVAIGTLSNNTQLPYYFRGNGNYTLTLTSAAPTITFTPTEDFVGEITNVSVAPITPSPATLRITDSSGDSRFEIRSGGFTYNTFLGVDAGRNTNDNVLGYNTAVGYDALWSNIGTFNNVAVGDSAMYANTIGGNNTAVGESAMQNTSSGSNNVAVGFVAGGGIVGGYQNVAIGAFAGAPANGYNSVAIGYTTLESDTLGIGNTAVGSEDMWEDRTGSSNTAVGNFALYGLTGGNNNTAIGASALYYNDTASNNTGVGDSALYRNTTGGNNVSIGYNALYSNTTGGSNTAVGYEAIQNNLSGGSNVAVGLATLQNATTSSSNTAVGNSALAGSTAGSLTISGTNNTAVGFNTLLDYINASNNTALGYQAMFYATSSSYNVAVGTSAGRGQSTNDAYTGLMALGYRAGYNLANGSNYNTLIGYQAGYNITTGADNILIGSATSSSGVANLTSGSQNILLGENESLPSATANGQLDIGNEIYGTNITGTGSVLSNGDIGIGATTPYSRLQVTGPDTASTSAVAVVNSASTTIFSVFDDGNSTYSGSIFQSSDQRLKTDVESLDASSSLAAIEQLNPVSYLRIDQPGTGENLGFIAQQVQQVFPQLVSTTSPTALTPDGTLTLNYGGLISPIVSAIQEITNVGGLFEQNLTAWLGNAENGITDLFAQNIDAQDELCVGSTCVTPAQFQAMVAAAGQASSSGQGSSDSSPDNSEATDTPPVIQVNGDNPAVVQVGATYNDLGATITGPQADLNLGIQTFVNGAPMSPVVIDTSQAATDTIDYVATDQNGLAATSTRTVIIEAVPSIIPTDDASSTDATSTDATSTAQ